MMVDLQTRHLGVNKGIPTVVIAACSMTIVLSVAAHSSVLSLIYASGSAAPHTPNLPTSGIVVQAVYCGHCSRRPPKSSLAYCTGVLVAHCYGCCLLTESGHLKLAGAGALGTLIVPLVASVKWQQWSKTGVTCVCTHVPISSLGQSLLVVVIGSIMRTVGAFVSVLGLGSGLNWRESAFVAFTWLPKAAPSAALAPLYLETARVFGDERQMAIGITMVSMATVSILLTAPIGAILIKCTASHLLHNGGKVTLNGADSKDDKELQKLQPDQNNAQSV
ncbi:unnamed protein product [Sphagnum balticum]